MSEKIKSIAFKVKLRGRGIVNFDSNDAKYKMASMFPEEWCYFQHNNAKIAKHNFYLTDKKHVRLDSDMKETERLVYERKVKISGDCIRNAIFSDDMPFQSTNILSDKNMLFGVLATPYALLRGYMFVNDVEAMKRKSPVSVTSAEQISEGISVFEVGTTRGEKKKPTSEDDKSDTSLRYEENIGDIEYEFISTVDLKELAFISLSEVYDRQGFSPDFSSLFCEKLSKKIGSPVSGVNLYYNKDSINEWPEDGILLSPVQVIELCKYYIVKLLRIRINRAKAYAATIEVKMKFISDVLEDNINNDDGWITVKSESDFKINPEEVAVRYEVFDHEAHKELMNKVDEYKKMESSVKAKKTKEKAESVEKKKKQKAEKTQAKEQEKTD